MSNNEPIEPTCPPSYHLDKTICKCVKDTSPTDCPPLHHWDTSLGKCIPDLEPPITPPVEPPAQGVILWDSNIHLKTGQTFTVEDVHGPQTPDSKGLWMAASGNPRLIVDPDGTYHLEADSGHGRVYIRATNFNCRLESDFMFEDSNIDNSTWRLRCRHNEGGDCSNRFGGIGYTIERQGVGHKTESCHNLHENSIDKPLTTAIKDQQWIRVRCDCKNSPDNTKILLSMAIDYKDGKGFQTVLEGEHPSPKPYYMDEPKFMEESYFWLRINNTKTGRVAFKNTVLTQITSSTTDEPVIPPVTPPVEPPVEPPVTPPPSGTLDDNGVQMLHKTTGQFVDQEVGGDPAGNGQRYSVNHKYQNYMLIGYFKTGPNQELIEHKTDGPNHGSCTQLPKCCWTEPAIELETGKSHLSSEWPHPKNHDPGPAPSMVSLNQNLKNKWIGYCVVAYQDGEFRTIEQWCDPTGLDAAGKPNNAWQLTLKETDKGQITNPELAKRKMFVEGKGMESEIRMHGDTGKHGETTDMKFCRVYELATPIQ